MSSSSLTEVPNTLLSILFDRLYQETSVQLGNKFRLHSFFAPASTRRKTVRTSPSALLPSVSIEELEQKLWVDIPVAEGWYQSLRASFVHVLTSDSLELALTFVLSWLPLHSSLYRDFKPLARESIYPTSPSDPVTLFLASSGWRYDLFIKNVKNFDPYDQRQWDIAECVVDYTIADVVGTCLEHCFEGANLSSHMVHHLVHVALHCFRNLEPQWPANAGLWKELRERVLQRWSVNLALLSRHFSGADPMLFLTIFSAAQLSSEDAVSYFRGLGMLQIDISIDAGVKRAVDFMETMLALVDSKKNKSTKLKALQVACLDSVLRSITWDESILPISDKSKAIYRRALRWMSKSEELEASALQLASTLLAHSSSRFFLEEFEPFVVKRLLKGVWSKRRDLYLECILRILQGRFVGPVGVRLPPTSAATTSALSFTTLVYGPDGNNAPVATVNARIQTLVLGLFSKKSQLFRSSEGVTPACFEVALQISAANLAYARELMLPTLLSEVRSSNPGNLCIGVGLLRRIIDPSTRFSEAAPCFRAAETSTPLPELSTILGATLYKLLFLCEQEVGLKACGTLSTESDRSPAEVCPLVSQPFLRWCADACASYCARVPSEQSLSEQLQSDTTQFAILRWYRAAVDSPLNAHEWSIQQQQSVRLLCSSTLQVLVGWFDAVLAKNAAPLPGLELTMPLGELFIPDLSVTPFDEASGDDLPGGGSSASLPTPAMASSSGASTHASTSSSSFAATFAALDPNTVISHTQLPPFQAAGPAMPPLQVSGSFSSSSGVLAPPQTPRGAAAQAPNLTSLLLKKSFSSLGTGRGQNMLKLGASVQANEIDLQVMGYKEWIKSLALKKARPQHPDHRAFLELYREVLQAMRYRLPDEFHASMEDPLRFFGQSLLHADATISSTAATTLQHIFAHNPELRNELLMALGRLALHPSHLLNPHHVFIVCSRLLLVLDFWAVLRMCERSLLSQYDRYPLSAETAAYLESVGMMLLCQPDPHLRTIALHMFDSIYSLLPSRTSSVSFALFLNLKDIQETVRLKYLRDAARGLPLDLSSVKAMAGSSPCAADHEGGGYPCHARRSLELAALADVAGSHCQLLWSYYLVEIGRVCTSLQVELEAVRQQLIHVLELADALPLEDGDDARIFSHDSRILRRNYLALFCAISSKASIEPCLSLFKSSVLPALYSDVAWVRDVVFLAAGAIHPSSIPALLATLVQWYQDQAVKRRPAVLRWVFKTARFLLQERSMPLLFSDFGGPFLASCLFITDLIANTFGHPKPSMVSALRPENVAMFLDAYLFVFYLSDAVTLPTQEIELLPCHMTGPVRRRLRANPISEAWSASQRRSLVFALISWTSSLSSTAGTLYRWSAEESNELAKMLRSVPSLKRDTRQLEIDRSLRDIHLLAPHVVESVLRLGPLFDREDLDKTDAFFRSIPSMNWFVQVEKLGRKPLRWLLANHFPQLFFVFLDLTYQQAVEPDRPVVFLEAISDQIIDGSSSLSNSALAFLQGAVVAQGLTFAPRYLRSGLSSEHHKAVKAFPARLETRTDKLAYEPVDDAFSLNIKDVAGSLLFLLFLRTLDVLAPVRQRAFELLTRLIPTGMGLDRELPVSRASLELSEKLGAFGRTNASVLRASARQNGLACSATAATTVPMFTEKVFAEGFQRFSRLQHRSDQLWVLEFLLPWCDNLQLGQVGEHNLLESSAADFLGAVYSQFTLNFLRSDVTDMPPPLLALWLRLACRGRAAQDPQGGQPNLGFILKYLLSRCPESEADLAMCRHLFLAYYAAAPAATLAVLLHQLSFAGITESLGKVNADPNLDISVGTVTDLQKKIDAQADHDVELQRAATTARQYHLVRQAILSLLPDLIAADVVSMLPSLHVVFNWSMLRLENPDEALLLRPLLQHVIDALLHQLPARLPGRLQPMSEIQRSQHQLVGGALQALRQALGFSSFSIDWNYDRYLLDDAAVLSTIFLSAEASSYSSKRGAGAKKPSSLADSHAQMNTASFRSSSSSELGSLRSCSTDSRGMTKSLMKQLQLLAHADTWLCETSVADLVGVLCAAVIPYEPGLVDRWGEEALLWATEYQDLQLSLLAHQVFRCLLSPIHASSITNLFHSLLQASVQLESSLEQLLLVSSQSHAAVKMTTPVDLLATLTVLARGKTREILLTFQSIAQVTSSLSPLNMIFWATISFLHLNHPTFAPLYFQALGLLQYFCGPSSSYFDQVLPGDLEVFFGQIRQAQNWNFAGLQPLVLLGLQNELTDRRAAQLLVRFLRLGAHPHRALISPSPAQQFTTVLGLSCWLHHVARITSFDSQHPARRFALQTCQDMISALSDPQVVAGLPEARALVQGLEGYHTGRPDAFCEAICAALARECLPKHSQSLVDTLVWMLEHTPTLSQSIFTISRAFVSLQPASPSPSPFAVLIHKSVALISRERLEDTKSLFSATCRSSTFGPSISLPSPAPSPPPISHHDLHLTSRALSALASFAPFGEGLPKDLTPYDIQGANPLIRVVGSLSIAVRSSSAPSAPNKSDFELLQMQLGGLTASTLSLPPTLTDTNLAELDAALSGLDHFVVDDEPPLDLKDVLNLENLLGAAPSVPSSSSSSISPSRDHNGLQELINRAAEPAEIEDLTSALDELEQYM